MSTAAKEVEALEMDLLLNKARTSQLQTHMSDFFKLTCTLEEK